MSCGRMPLFPQCCGRESSMRMPLFDGCCCPHPGCADCQTVRIVNPACREEFVDVELCVDGEGNLSICVRRPPRPCPPRRKNRCDCPPWCR